MELCPVWYEVKVPFIHEWRDQSKKISMVCGSIYCERGKEQGSKICICYIPFDRRYAWMDKISGYCITTIKLSALLETNFCSLSVFFTLEEKVILACLLLKWCSEKRYEREKTGNHWRWPLKSLSTTFIYPACLWATGYVNNLFLCPSLTDYHCIVRACGNCYLYSSERSITFERLHCLAVFFVRSAKNLFTWWASEKKQDASLKISIYIYMHQTKSRHKIKDSLQLSLIILLADFYENNPGLVSYDRTALWTVIYHCGRFSFSVLKWISLQARLRLSCFKLL